jgi:hypothetical protein
MLVEVEWARFEDGITLARRNVAAADAGPSMLSPAKVLRAGPAPLTRRALYATCGKDGDITNDTRGI